MRDERHRDKKKRESSWHPVADLHHALVCVHELHGAMDPGDAALQLWGGKQTECAHSEVPVAPPLTLDPPTTVHPHLMSLHPLSPPLPHPHPCHSPAPYPTAPPLTPCVLLHLAPPALEAALQHAQLVFSDVPRGGVHG